MGLEEQIGAILAAHTGRRGTLLPLLHDVQAALGCIPDAAVPLIAEGLNITRAEVHGVITFYHDFRRVPPPRHLVRLCRAEACQARGAVAVEAAAVASLGVAMGARRADDRVGLEPAYCLGLCATGPNALVDGRPVSRLNPERMAQLAGELL